jgi:hypothetical protein
MCKDIHTPYLRHPCRTRGFGAPGESGSAAGTHNVALQTSALLYFAQTQSIFSIWSDACNRLTLGKGHFPLQVWTLELPVQSLLPSSNVASKVPGCRSPQAIPVPFTNLPCYCFPLYPVLGTDCTVLVHSNWHKHDHDRSLLLVFVEL